MLLERFVDVKKGVLDLGNGIGELGGFGWLSSLELGVASLI